MRILALTAVAALLVAACASTASPSPSPSGVPSATAPSASVLPSAGPSGSPSPSASVAPSATPEASLGPASWTELTSAGEGPARREDHTWTVAAGTGVAYLFGGRSGTAVYEDLWAYELATDSWRVVAPHGDWPRARFGHEAVWVPDLGLVVWAGQLNGSTFYDDLWLYDPARDAWRPLPGDGDRPTARYGSCAVLLRGELWVSHGFTAEGSRFADTKAYDFSSETWRDATPPGQVPVERCLHGCWTVATTGGLVLYGGQTTGVAALGDLWRLDDAGSPVWRKVEGGLPAERRLFAHAPWRGGEIVVGGGGLDGAFLDDAYLVDGETLGFEALTIDGTRPSGRSGAELVADPTRDRLLLFGGLDGTGARDDLWELTFP
jgi:hypothetical protein